MRLINVDTLELESFTDDYEAPPFVILSHCWGEGEVSLQDVQGLPHNELDRKTGWRKIVDFCLLIKKHRGFTDYRGEKCSWAWVDTCCIDKTSSAELSEAINSMYRWYRKAICCFVWLEDLEAQRTGEEGACEIIPTMFESCRWFTRGWTLQELLAPSIVHFFDKSGRYFGSKASLSKSIERVTSIDRDALILGIWTHCNIAQRMSWAANRTTTRREDLAYCLMGLFDVNMPLLYGEGDRAFIRLQEEILKESDDQSIFAWDAAPGHVGGVDPHPATDHSSIGVLATHPSQFRNGATIETLPSAGACATLTARGIQIDAPVVNQQVVSRGTAQTEEIKVALLSCRFINDVNSRVGLPLSPDESVSGSANNFTRARKPQAVVRVPWRGAPFQHQQTPTIFIAKRGRKNDNQLKRLWRCVVQYGGMGEGFKMIHAEPEEFWTQSSTPSCTMVLPRYGGQAVNAVVSFAWSSYPAEAFSVVMKLVPNTQYNTRVCLMRSVWVDQQTTLDQAHDMIAKMDRLGGGNVPEEWLKFDDEKGTIQANLGIRSDFVFEISLSRMVRHRLPTRHRPP